MIFKKVDKKVKLYESSGGESDLPVIHPFTNKPRCSCWHFQDRHHLFIHVFNYCIGYNGKHCPHSFTLTAPHAEFCEICRIMSEKAQRNPFILQMSFLWLTPYILFHNVSLLVGFKSAHSTGQRNTWRSLTSRWPDQTQTAWEEAGHKVNQS